MLVKDCMTRHPIMISPETPAAKAQTLMIENKVRHLPVVRDGKRLVGLITRENLMVPPSDLGSLNVWEISRLLSNIKAEDVMVKGKALVTIGPEETLENAAALMIEQKIGCLPVIEDGVVVGIITEVDMLAKLSELLGGNVAGVRATIRIPNKVGEYAKIFSAISKHGWGIYASGGAETPKQPEFWDIVIKVREVSEEDLRAVLEGIEGHKVIDIRMIP
ncbi:MAG: CBS domain-containing protein [Anaerolineales bacterium]|nr:CBS domain-containing protein [Anaerolineales bacterium]